MCRWMAYAGPSVYLENLLFKQKNSLISQSLRATKSAYVTNGDGFGVAWYGKRNKPGLFKDILPAWNDENLRELSQHIESNLFLAHVRAATGTSVSRTNCHPYAYQNWSFMHNGMIGDWQMNRRDIESMISKDLYHLRHGTTDSEALFLLALSEGLADDPIMGMSKAVGKVVDVMRCNGSMNPLRISAALSDGQCIWAFRFSSDKQSPSLYYGTPDTHSEVGSGLVSTIASEPIDDEDEGSWTGVCEGSALHWKNGHVCLSPFDPMTSL